MGFPPQGGAAGGAGVQSMEFWAGDGNIPLITVTAAPQNIPLVTTVVVAGLPATATLTRVVALIKPALIRDTSGAVNAINNAACLLAVDLDPAYGSTVGAINIADNSWGVTATAPERGGDKLEGSIDVKAEVTGNGTYVARFEAIQADGANLLLVDVAWGLKFYFT